MTAIICTVDVVLLTLHANELKFVALERDHEPFRNRPALPGGYIRPEIDADAAHAAARMLAEKTDITSPYLEQLASFSGPDRDPRGWSVSIAYYALVPPELLTCGRAPGLHLLPCSQARGLPFDHDLIVADALSRVRSKSSYSSLPVHLCAEPFSLPQLQAVYEAILGEPINKVSFRRKMEELDMLEALAGEFLTGAHRPAQLYRVKPAYRARLSLSHRAIAAKGGEER